MKPTQETYCRRGRHVSVRTLKHRAGGFFGLREVVLAGAAGVLKRLADDGREVAAGFAG